MAQSDDILSQYSATALQQRGPIADMATGDGLLLTDKLFSLGMARAPTKTVVAAAPPVMRRLSEVIGQTGHLALASAAALTSPNVETPTAISAALGGQAQ